MQENEITNIANRINKSELYETIRDDKKIYAYTTFLRAIPFNKDGLIEVYRHILYSMHVSGLYYNHDAVKSAQVIGNIIGHYHPHGDVAVYGSMVTLSQPWTMNYPLIQGLGNWGNILGDGAAAARYTNCRLSDFATDIIETISPNTVDFGPNYDDSVQEATYIPFKVPQLLLNGSYGIAESYITSVPCHNLNDVIGLCRRYIANKNISNEKLVEGFYPDFPNYGIITNKSEIEEAYKHGTKANIKMKSTIDIDRIDQRIYIRDLPYGHTKTNITNVLIAQNLNKHAVLSKILDITDMKTMRNGFEHFEFEVIFEKSCNILEVARDLEKFCLTKTIPLSIIFNYNDTVGNVLIKDIIVQWYNVIRTTKLRKYSYKATQLQNKTYILEGLIIIYDSINEVIEFSKTAKSDKEFINWLIKRFNVSLIQAEAIADTKLRQLSAHSKDFLYNSIEENKKSIAILENDMMNVDIHILSDLDFISKKYGRPRRTVVMDEGDEQIESIPMSNGALIYSHNQYAIFDLQNIVNGKALMNGLKSYKIDGKNVKEICGVQNIATDVDSLIVFTRDGTAKKIDTTEIVGINNWIVLDDIEIAGMIPISKSIDRIVIISENDKIRVIESTEINKQYVNVGKIKAAQKIEYDADHLIVATSNGKYQCIPIADIPLLSRSASGVQINIPHDEDVSLCQVNILGEDSLMLSLNETNENLDYIMKVELEHLEITNRVNKPKSLLQLDNNYKLLSINKGNSKFKNSKLVLLGKHSSSQMSVQNFKNSDICVTPKRVPTAPIAIVQYSI